MKICDQHKFVIITSQSRCLLKYLCCCRCYYGNPKDCFSKIIDTDAAVAATAICQWIYSMRNAPNLQIDSFKHLQRHWTIFIFFLIKIHGMCTPSGCRRWRKKERKNNKILNGCFSFVVRYYIRRNMECHFRANLASLCSGQL